MSKLKFEKLKIKTLPGRNALMNVAELKDYIDFDVKRVYYTTNINGDTSQHCHLKEQELFIMVAGECTAVIDRGQGLEDITFETADTLYVGNYVWHGFKDFKAGSIMLALSSTNYNPTRQDYIEDYSKYKLVLKKFGI